MLLTRVPGQLFDTLVDYAELPDGAFLSLAAFGVANCTG
jgi:hypothetical protein